MLAIAPAALALEVVSISISASEGPYLTGDIITLSADATYDDDSTADITADTTFIITNPSSSSTTVGPSATPTYTVSIPGMYTITGYYNPDGAIFTDTIYIMVHSLTVEKKLVGGSESPPEYVPIETPVRFELEMTVENPDDAEDVDLEDVMLMDGIGADLDLVVQNDGGGDYIFIVDGTRYYLGIEDDIYYGGVDIDGDTYDDLTWNQANKKFHKPNQPQKRCATIIAWNISELEEDSSITLKFNVTTNSFTAGPHEKQSYTSVCHQELNSGPEVQYSYTLDENVYYDTVVGEPVIVSAYDPTEGADSDGDGVEDLVEVEAGTDPCDPEDFPTGVP
jgi:hypothetical protein